MKKLFLFLLTTGSLFANTTMCFKQNHIDISTIEDTSLDGGECQSKFSVKQMKEKDWKVSDIKITPKNNTYDFVYIFNKKTVIQDTELEKSIIKKIEQKKEVKKQKSLQDEINEGKKIYTNKCQECHGVKGEISVYNETEPLNKISYKDMKFIINQYTFDREDFGYGYEFIMKPIASSINSEELKKVHKYLENINRK